MEELARESARIATPSIHRVANDREMRVHEVYADLVRPAGDRLDVQEGRAVVPAAPRGDARKTRDRVAAAGPNQHASPVIRIAQQRRFDDRRGIAGVAPHQREVFLRETLRLQLPPEGEL